MITSFRKFLIAAAFATASVLPAAAHATDVKVGYVDPTRILAEAPQNDAAVAQLEKEFKSRESRLRADQARLQEAEARLLKEGPVMKESERRKLERDILSQKRELSRAQDEFKEDLNIRRNELLQDLQRKVVAAIIAAAKEKQFDMILNSDAVIYHSDRVDITDSVIKTLKAQFAKAKK